MLLLVLALLTVGTAVSALGNESLRVCQSKANGGLACKCSTSHNELVDPVLEVDCSSLNLSALPEEWQISQFPRHLDLSRNQLSSLVKEQFSRWGNLEELNLSRNKFTSLNEDVFLGLTNLRNLDLSYNMLTNLPEKIFSGLSVLSTLHLEMNGLHDLHPDVFASTPHLESLFLGHNPDLGKSIMNSADFLSIVLPKNLNTLALNNMSIDEFPKNSFSEVTQVRYLSLADNPMKNVDTFPSSLDTLDISGTEIEIILPGDFKSYPKLRNLHMDRLIHLQSVQPKAFEGLQSLEVLTMENCIQFHEFDEMAFGDEKSVAVPLKRLSLARSGLHTLSSKTLVSVKPTLEHLSLHGNPWRCDCNLVWLRNTDFSLEDPEYLRCFSPEQHHNKLLLSVSPDEFICAPAARKVLYSLVTVVNIVLIVIVLAICVIVLMMMRHKGWVSCMPRKKVGTYSPVAEPSRSELEWDDKDLEHIWSTSGSRQVP